jgi:hypothetical protein
MWLSSMEDTMPLRNVSAKNPFLAQVKSGTTTEEFAAAAEKNWVRKSRILILVDGQIAVVPYRPEGSIQSSSAFGISVAIGHIKDFFSGLSSFDVKVATRDGDGSPKPGHDLTGFRYSAKTLARFDQVWMFGYQPGNLKPDSLDPADDEIIEFPESNPLHQLELKALAQWMDKGGSVFAAGDHHVLGASMCHKVPRVSTMRAWTIADGVPTRDFTTRYQTTRPLTLEQSLGTSQIPFANEEDRAPQPIEWVSFPRYSGPHPLLSHPELGPIDVLPDHMHEGRCFDFGDRGWQLGKRDARFDFMGYSNEHYPTAGNVRPLPHVVAWGTTPADPPLDYEFGDQPYRRFPLIAAYDGQAIGIGRVVVDSTWHHWFDMNLRGILDASLHTRDSSMIDRILRYYVNVGIYLASPYWRAGLVLGWLKREQFNYFGREAIDLTADAIQVGRTAISHLQREIGRPWLSESLTDFLSDDPLWPRVRASLDKTSRGRCSLQFETIEQAVIGEVVRAAYSDMGELNRQLARKGVITSTPLFHGLDAAARAGASRGLRAAIESHRSDLQLGTEELGSLTEQK